MGKSKIAELIKVDGYSPTAKYLQISNSIIQAIKNERIKIGDNLPSINELSTELDIARDTVERGYKHLRELGVLDSIPRRGFFIKSPGPSRPLKIFLLFNKLSEHKKKIYDAFYKTLGEEALIDFYIYHNDFSLFKRLILERSPDYTHCVIIPHFLESGEHAFELINTIPKDQLVILDKLVEGVTGEFAAAYENFENDIYSALKEALVPLSKYRTIKIIFPPHSYYPPEIIHGCRKFCQEHDFSYAVVDNIQDEIIREGVVYISVMEKDLVTLIEKVLEAQLRVGQQVGIISYNEIPLKKIILDGITTISTDFEEMGKMAASLILTHSKSHVEVPFFLNLRSSL
ncbi:MAG: GntR family transcriptional regulator [Bacteroidota bacterium]|nr:GntR family transcriptional regulator [Bacteroidota bacterium]